MGSFLRASAAAFALSNDITFTGPPTESELACVDLNTVLHNMDGVDYFIHRVSHFIEDMLVLPAPIVISRETKEDLKRLNKLLLSLDSGIL